MSRTGCNFDGNLDDTKFSEPIPWIGIYVAAASLVCLIAMVMDTIHGIRQRKFWFPSKFFSLNAMSLTLIAAAAKLCVDLNTPMPRRHEQLAKLSSSVLICIIIGNSMPSLGMMDTKEMTMNIIAVAILVITIIVNICIQLGTGVIYVFWEEHASTMVLMLVLLLMMISSALSIPTIKHFLELKYRKKLDIALKEECSNEFGETVVKKLREDLMKHWIMAHTSNPQFVLGRSVTCTASGAFCLLSAIILAEAMIKSYLMPWSFKFCRGESDYKWSAGLILAVQTVAVGLGTIAPAFRWFIAINFKCPLIGMNNCRKEFYVESYWISSLLETKERPLHLRIRNRHYRKLVHDARLLSLNFCIQMQIWIVLMSKSVCLVSIFIVSQIFLCCNYFKDLKSKLGVSSMHSGEESEAGSKLDLRRFVMHLEGENELVEVIMKNNRDATNHWIQVGEKKQPKHLIKLLKKSSYLQCIEGVGAFESNQIPSLDIEEPPHCWALPVVTLASIAVALPNINNETIKQLICTLNESLPYVKLIENNLDREGNFINVRKAADTVWLGVELYHKWLDLELHKLSLQSKGPSEVLERLSDAAKTKYEELKIKMNICLKETPSRWPIKVLAANCMYQISQTILLNHKNKINNSSESLFEAITTTIADILGACLTNIPCVIRIKCCDSAIEEKENSVRLGAHILGKTKSILDMLTQECTSQFGCSSNG